VRVEQCGQFVSSLGQRTPMSPTSSVATSKTRRKGKRRVIVAEFDWQPSAQTSPFWDLFCNDRRIRPHWCPEWGI
jgi:hypothetical protein